MDNFVKIVTGWVQQYFERGKDGVFVCTGQEFCVGDDMVPGFVDDWEQPIDPPECKYQPYDMVQPDNTKREQDLLDATREILSDFNRYGEELQAGDNGEYGAESAIGRLNTAIEQYNS